MKVLVVDDDMLVRRIIKSSLEAAGYGVTESGDGDDALEKLAGGGFDLLLADNVVPSGGDLSVAEYARRNNPSLPIVIVSGEQPETARPDVLSKPFKKHDLLRVVRQSLSKNVKIS